jgi:DNA-binding CsgD family transcriptional regulator
MSKSEHRRPSDAGGVAAHRPQLRYLSVQHAAIAMKLTPREMDVVLQLGRGASATQLSRNLGISQLTGASYVRDLKEKLRMTRLELAVMGYSLLGQPGDGQIPIAA